MTPTKATAPLMTSITQATSRARTTLWARRRRPLSVEALVTVVMCLFSTTVGVLVYLAPQYIPFTSLTLRPRRCRRRC